MKVAFDQDRPVIAAAEIAPLLELDVPGFQDQTRSGRIRSIVEPGEGEDDGRFRLTFQSQQWRVRLTCRRGGNVLTLTRVQLKASSAAHGRTFPPQICPDRIWRHAQAASLSKAALCP